ncbi:PREDICTED: LOW QUALITY PROTEIN: alpha-protein kinase 3-like [Elephantulus edwardii]|uniref:LOW QUALITY PROTEIN: alpha-protein kinase 3-like n=1 Tax=Elephantulus edwardii TaxID=28737 RepID=UPI0003F0A7DA|nr:PREDICTED: LOW QUALITY PROTEIN: alpha-protein kinase 3-like [Elephantulus edwardii]
MGLGGVGAPPEARAPLAAWATSRRGQAGEGQQQVTTARPGAINRSARQPAERRRRGARRAGVAAWAGAWRAGAGAAMGTRRLLSREWGAGVRAGAGGDGEDDGPVWTPSPASRSYLLSVRPETSLSSNRLSHPSSGRSTFCSIIAQLTEETQPLFETTLKSRAVSEDSDVRFTCIVTGYPEPEVTWYKDDTELDRYCGLPKYEITHQGNRHTLQLYRCREEDAAIYQASARNSKGIVSCSGVLEVGTMTEYKIHQRWFDKLKRKAAAKMREIEQSWKHGKEAAEEDTLRKLSPDRFQRKRRLSGAQVPVSPAPPRETEGGPPTSWQEGETEPAQHPGMGLINSFAPGEVTTNGEAATENGEDSLLTYICEAMELGPQRAPKKESGAKKKKKDEAPQHGLQKSESEQAAHGHHSENHGPSSDRPDSCEMQGPRDTAQVQARPRGRASRAAGSSGADGTRKMGSAMLPQDKAQDVSALGPAPTPEVYFSLKDMYLESTRAARSQKEGPQSLSDRAPQEMPMGKTSSQARAEESAASSQLTPTLAPQQMRLLNRKRFAPPKPKVEPTTNSRPDSSLSQAPEPGPQALGKLQTQASTPVPTPPARRRHSTRESPLQGRAGHRTSGEALEPQTTTVPTTLASSTSDITSLGLSTSRSQDTIEPMDTETQEDRSTSADWRTGGNKNAQTAEEGQTDRRRLTDEKMEKNQTQTTPRTQAERKAQVDIVTRESVRTQACESSQEDVVTQVERTQTGERMQQDGKMEAEDGLQEDRRMQGEKGMWSEGGTPTAVEGHPEEKPRLRLSRLSTAPAHPPSEGPRPQIARDFEQTPEMPSDPAKPTVLCSGEAAGISSRNHEQSVPGTLSGHLTLPALLSADSNLEQRGEEGCQRSGSSPGKDKLDDSLFKGPKEDQLGEVPPVDLRSCLPAGLGAEGPSMPSLPGTSPASKPLEGLPRTLTSRHTSADTFLPSGAQALLGSAPTLHLGTGAPTQSYPPGMVAPVSSDGACAKVPDVEGRTPGPRSCDPGLIDSLKNYLLLLLKLSGTETSGGVAEPQAGEATGAPASSSTLVPTVEVAGLSPRTSRRILERVENNHLVQSAQTVLLSPCTSRRLTGLLDREVQAGQQALAAARGSRGPGSSLLSVPAIVVGEEGSGPISEEGSSQGEGEASSERPELLGVNPRSSVGGPAGEAGEELLSAEHGVQEPFHEVVALAEAPAGLPAATPEELALGARRKRFLPKVRATGEGEVVKAEERESPTVSPRGPRKSLAPGSPGTPGSERRSPTQGRKAGLLEVPRTEEEPVPGDLASGPDAEPALDEGKQDALAKPKKAEDLLKAPQVIRKIRVEQFPDASGSLKLWCQFFNILSDSVLTWAKDQRPVGEVGRSAGDEGPAALAIVQASPVDCGVYRCTIHNEHGSASTDFCLSPEVLSGFISREEGEVGEEIEMTPMVFAKGLADSGCWGDKLFGRLVSEELRGEGHRCSLQKASQAKVIYGLEPIFESGRTCVIKVSSLLVFGPSNETSSLLGRNYDVTIQGCKIQNMSREYCKIFAAEARAVTGFGEVPEIIPLYLIYRPANNIPYATLEEDLGKPLETYCSREWGCAGAPTAPSSSEAMHKCQTFQHWLYQWTNGSFLVTDLAGVDWKMTDVQIATKLRGYQGLKESCCPGLLDQFTASHQCNAYCEKLGLKPLKGPETTHPQAKAKGSKSPSAGRKGAQLSPQPPRRGLPSPQGSRKSVPSPKATAQASEAVTARLLGQPATQEGGSKAQSMR